MLTSFQKRKLTKLFTMYDLANQGVIRLSDFEKIAQNLAKLRKWKAGSPEESHLNQQYTYRWLRLRDEIKQSAHHRRDHQVTLEEWLIYYESLLEDETFRHDVQSMGNLIFEVIDLDQNQNIDLPEWTNLFRVYHLPIVYAKISFEQLDDDQDGFLTQENILRALHEFYWSQNPDDLGNYLFGPV